MPCSPDAVAERLAELGIAATAIRQAASPVALWVVTGWGDLERASLAMLSREEQARADRFRCEDLSNRYRAAHVARRCVVERCFGILAAAQDYHAGPRGKPYLAGYPQANVSLSYGGSRLLIGIAAGAALGVDIEPLRPIEEAASLAALYYTPCERSLLALAGTGTEAFNRLFLSIWTRKEACIKAAGLSLDEHLLSTLECGAANPAAVRVGNCQLRTDTTLCDRSYLVSWAWNVSPYARVMQQTVRVVAPR